MSYVDNIMEDSGGAITTLDVPTSGGFNLGNWGGFAGDMVKLYASRTIKDVNAVQTGDATATPGMNGQPVAASVGMSKNTLIIGGLVVAALVALVVLSK